MVTTLLRSSLREIRKSMGRYLAILAIVGLGVGFFAGLRMSQPDMIATGVEYLAEYELHDFRLLSTLGFTEEDVRYFAGLEGVKTARGSVYTEFLFHGEDDEDNVLIAHSLTDGVNMPELTAGRMPERGDECLADEMVFPESAIGTTVQVARSNDEDTLELLAYDAYTIVGLAASPLYLNFERGTSSIGSGSIGGFVLIPEDGFDFEAYHEIFLTLENTPDAYSDAYEALIDGRKPELEELTGDRGDLRFETIYADAMEEIADAEQELADGWEEYRTERADAERELADALQELADGEQEYADSLADYEQGKLDYADGLADYEQGKLDYADGLREYEEGLSEIADAEQELADGWLEYEDARAEVEQELADALQELTDGEKEYADGLKEYREGLAELADAEEAIVEGEQELREARRELSAARRELSAAQEQLEAVRAELAAGDRSYQQLSSLYEAGQAMVEGFSGYGVTSVGGLFSLADASPEVAAALDAALQAQGSSLSAFRSGWDAAAEQLGGSLNERSLAALRAQLDEGWEEYRRGQRDYEDASEQIQGGREEIDSGLEELEEAKVELEEGRLELLEVEQELADARAELDDGWQEYYDGVAEAEQELADAYQELMDGEAELADGKQELLDVQRELEDVNQELLDAQRELADVQQELADAPAEFADARAELDDGWAEYYDGLAEAEQEFADAEAELADGEQEISDAREELADLKRADVYVLTRSENTGYACFDNDTSIIAAISVVFPVFFFLVAALVCMTTMKRMVDEQRTQIGVLKAMGYSNRQIMGKYLLYSGSAATIGSVAGYALGSCALPLVIWEIYAIMYGFADLKLIFDPALAAVSFAAALLCSMGATWLSCRVELTKPAAELIRPKAPKAGRRVFLEYITPVWKHLGFLQKVSVRNVLRYRSRLIMMVLGIGGCTALLVTGFGLRDSISSVMDDQFEQITLYDYSVSFQDPLTQADAEAYLADRGWSSEAGLLVHSGSTDLMADGGTKSVYLVISPAGSLDGFISLHSGEEAIAYPGTDEAVINRGLAEELGVAVGDTIQLRDEDLGTLTVAVSAICDNFVSNYVYVAEETYAKQLRTVPEYKTMFLLAREGADPYAEGVYLAEGENVSSVQVNEATREQVGSMLSRLDYIVIVVVVCAGALAFIVLFNLTNINITERVREIATIKVLGFHQNEVASYVFREIRMLAVLGSLVGLLMGKALHIFVMEQVQVDGMFFPSYILPVSYLLSIGLTMLFTILITCAMRPRLNQVDMAESLKSIE